MSGLDINESSAHIADYQELGDTTPTTTNRNNNSNKRRLKSNSSETWAETLCRHQPKLSFKGWRSNRLSNQCLPSRYHVLMYNTTAELLGLEEGKTLVPSGRRGSANTGYWFLGSSLNPLSRGLKRAKLSLTRALLIISLTDD